MTLKLFCLKTFLFILFYPLSVLFLIYIYIIYLIIIFINVTVFNSKWCDFFSSVSSAPPAPPVKPLKFSHSSSSSLLSPPERLQPSPADLRSCSSLQWEEPISPDSITDDGLALQPPLCSYVDRLRREGDGEEEEEEEEGGRRGLDRSSYHHAIAALENTSEEEEEDAGREKDGEEKRRRSSFQRPVVETESMFRPAEFGSRLLPPENKPLEMVVLKRAKELLLRHNHHSIARHLLMADCQVHTHTHTHTHTHIHTDTHRGAHMWGGVCVLNSNLFLFCRLWGYSEWVRSSKVRWACPRVWSWWRCRTVDSWGSTSWKGTQQTHNTHTHIIHNHGQLKRPVCPVMEINPPQQPLGDQIRR